METKNALTCSILIILHKTRKVNVILQPFHIFEPFLCSISTDWRSEQ